MNNLPQTKKYLGQHWLTDKTTLKNIVSFAKVTKNDTVLEVGPGIGTLTDYLALKAHRVIAVEYDTKLAGLLAARYANTNVEVIPDDILHLDFSMLPTGYKVVANIPYYLTSNLLRILLESSNPPSMMVLLVQKEVAERIAAKPKDMSVLSVSAQYYCNVFLGEVVRANMFTPSPKVDSQIIKLTYRPTPLFRDVNTRVFFRIVKAGFSERRKKLRSSLSSGLGISKIAVEQLLAKAGINHNLRAQELSLENWYAIYKAYQHEKIT